MAEFTGKDEIQGVDAKEQKIESRAASHGSGDESGSSAASAIGSSKQREFDEEMLTKQMGAFLLFSTNPKNHSFRVEQITLLMCHLSAHFATLSLSN